MPIVLNLNGSRISTENGQVYALPSFLTPILTLVCSMSIAGDLSAFRTIDEKNCVTAD